jgi:predicted ribosome quality control (RQC) complex YloA/Tae2 family protein
MLKVAEKKGKIAEGEKPKWKTNSTFYYPWAENALKNIKTVTQVSELVKMATFLTSLASAHEKTVAALGTNCDFEYYGFSFADWISDFKTRINVLELNKQRKELEEIEKLLEGLESQDRKEAKLLNEISKKLA